MRFYFYSSPGAVLENMREIVCIELRSVSKELQARRLLAVENSHSEHDGVLFKLPGTGEATALVVGGAGGVALVLSSR